MKRVSVKFTGLGTLKNPDHRQSKERRLTGASIKKGVWVVGWFLKGVRGRAANRTGRSLTGGGLNFGNTRVSLDSVVYAFNRGEDAAEIQRNYVTLSLAKVFAAISYYLHNKAKVDAYLEQQEIDYERRRA